MMRITFACSLLAAACTVNNNANPFGSGGATSVGTTATTASNDAGSSSGSSDDGVADEGEDSSSGADDPTTSADETGTTADTGGDPADAATTDGGALPGDGQPADGMWSQCTTARECGPIPALCIYLVDENMNPTDGFCSQTACANPAADCDANPGGTAPAVCVPMQIDGMADQVCALNCAAGTCPTGMVCTNITDLGMICI
jgi:hypothetical protein